MFTTKGELKDRAMEMAMKGKWKAALKAWEDILEQDKEDLHALQKTAEILVKMNRKKEALERYKTLMNTYNEEGFLLKAIAMAKIMLAVAPVDKSIQEDLKELLAERWADQPEALEGLGLHISTGADDEEEDEPSCLDEEITEEDVLDTGDPQEDTLSPRLSIPLFSKLGRKAFKGLVESLELRHVQPGERIISEGEPGDCMYIISRGEAVVLREKASGKSHPIQHIGEGGFFGEMALLAKTPRMASVEARTEMDLLVLPHETFMDLARREPSVKESIQETFKTRLLMALQRTSPLFRLFSSEEITELGKNFHIRFFDEGTPLLQQGQKGRGFFILLRGSCEVVESMAGASKIHNILKEGEIFGEISLLLQIPCTATVRTTTPSIVLGLGRESFERLILPHKRVKSFIEKLSEQRRSTTMASQCSTRPPPIPLAY